MPGARDRQELGHALYEAKNQRFKHAPPSQSTRASERAFRLDDELHRVDRRVAVQREREVDVHDGLAARARRAQPQAETDVVERSEARLRARIDSRDTANIDERRVADA